MVLSHIRYNSNPSSIPLEENLKNMTTKKGVFISVEGIDGAGKSTHIPFMIDYLTKNNISVVTQREPGGTPTGESLRQILLHSKNLHEITELLLMFASRQELIHNFIIPNLTQGIWVITDRFIDASIAYQGYGRKINLDKINILKSLLVPQINTDATFLFDTDLDIAIARLKKHNRVYDRIESEEQDFFKNVQLGYHNILKNEPQRVKLIKTNRDIESTQNEIITHLDILIDKFHAKN